MWSLDLEGYGGNRGIGLDLQHQICLESCPADSTSQIFCRGTGSTQMSYPTHPLAGMICMPSTTEFSSDLNPGVLEGFSGFSMFSDDFPVSTSEKIMTCNTKNLGEIPWLNFTGCHGTFFCFLAKLWSLRPQAPPLRLLGFYNVTR